MLPRPEIELSVRADPMIAGTERARQGFEKLKQTANGTFTDINSRASQGASALNTAGQAAEKATISMKSLGLSLVGIGTSTVGVVTSLSNLDRAAARVEKAQVAVARIEDQIASTRARLNSLTAKGKENTEQYAVNVSRLNTALEDLKVKQQDIKLSQDALNDSQILFATMLVNTSINSLFLLQSTGLLSTAFARLTITTTTQTGAMIAYGQASIFSTAGMKALTIASLEFMATPLGAALAAIAVGFVLFEQNVGGVRTGLERLIGVQKDGLSLFANMQKLMKQNTDQVGQLDTTTVGLSNTFSPGLTGSVDSATGSFGGFSTTIGGSIGGTGGGVIGQINELNLRLTETQRIFLQTQDAMDGGEAPSFLQTGRSPGDFAVFLNPDPVVKQNLEWMQKGFQIQQERTRITRELDLLGEIEINRAKALRLVLQEINADVDFKVKAGRITIDQAKEELALRRNIAIAVFDEAKAHKQVAEEQKKSLLPLKDLLESLKGTSTNNPLFGFNGVFSRDAGGGSTFGQTSSNRFLGFAGGIGSSITAGGKSFLSRVLNPNFGQTLGGGADSAIATFIAQSGGFSAAVPGDAISEGIMRAVATFATKRLLKLPFGENGDITSIETTGLGYKFANIGRPATGANFANPNFASGRNEGGHGGTPQWILTEAKLADSRAKLIRDSFGMGGPQSFSTLAGTLVPEAGELINSHMQMIMDAINGGNIKFARAQAAGNSYVIQRALELDRTIRMGYIQTYGRGETLSSLSKAFNKTQFELFNTIRTKFDVIDLEARKFFDDRENLQMVM